MCQEPKWLLPHSVIVFYSCIFQLSDFVKFFEGNQLLFEVSLIELAIIIIAENFVIFEFLLQQLFDLSCSHLPILEHFCRILSCAFKINFFMFLNVNSCFEESVLLCSSDDFLFDLNLLSLVNLFVQIYLQIHI